MWIKLSSTYAYKNSLNGNNLFPFKEFNSLIEKKKKMLIKIDDAKDPVFIILFVKTLHTKHRKIDMQEGHKMS